MVMVRAPAAENLNKPRRHRKKRRWHRKLRIEERTMDFMGFGIQTRKHMALVLSIDPKE
jgi:hypothetical protein